MKILMLGGTVFVGRSLVEQALAAGHAVTLFTRGRHNPDIFPQAESLRGDRDGGLAVLESGRWDAVVDTCGYVPRIVRQSARLLSSRVEHYTFISSISVYADFETVGADERYPTGTLDDPSVETVDAKTYGPLKALCERAVEEELPGRALIVRPGLIVGPNDPTDRFTYWPVRAARGGEVLAPGRPETPVQFIDVRDLTAWTLRMIEQRQTGVYNATGPWPETSMGELLQSCLQASASGAKIRWAEEKFLLENDAIPWTELPLWVPAEPENVGFHTSSIAKAVAAGLAFRPVAETVRDTLAWNATLPPDRKLKAGLTAEKEAELLRLWAERGARDEERRGEMGQT